MLVSYGSSSLRLGRVFQLLAVVCLFLLPSLALPARGDEPAANPPKADAAAPADPVKEPPAAKPESAEDLIKELQKLQHLRPSGNSREEFIQSYQEIQRRIIAGADQVLARPDAAGEAGDQVSAAAIGAKVSALRLLARLGNAQAKDEVKAFLEKYAGDKRPKVAEVVDMASLAERFTPAPNADPAALKAMAADAKKYFTTVKLRPEHVMIMQGLAAQLEQHEATADAADAYQAFGDLLSKHEDKRFVALGEQFAGTARRLGLMGQPMEVYATKLDGQPVDWKSYQGKVVLIDFWATWCGPCIQELPNILKNYELYHDRGFDVVGISVDQHRKDVEEFVAKRNLPWTVALDSDFKAAGKEKPLSTHYGVSGIPTVILVDREGKVVSLNARGPELGRLLAKLIGPPEAKKPEEKKPEEKKAEEKKAEEKKDSEPKKAE